MAYLCRAVIVAALLATLAGASTAGAQADSDAVARLSRQADQALAEKNLDAAAAALEKLAVLAPRVADVHAKAGLVYFQQGRMREAAAAFERALKLNPQIPNARLMLGLSLSELGRHEEALPILEPAFKRPPDPHVGRLIGLELLRAYTGMRQDAKAGALSQELLKRYPDDPEILFHTSRFHADRALETMLRLVKVAPHSVWVRQAFAEVHESRKNYELAIAEYREILRMEPRMPGIHYRLGRAILLRVRDEKSRDEALAEFQKELAIDPQSSKAEYEIGEIFRQRGEIERARDHFARAVENYPDFEEAQIALGRTLMNLRKPHDALPHLEAALRLNPTNEVSHFQLARVYRALGNAAGYEKEMDEFRKHQARPYAPGSAGGASLPFEWSAPEVTRQTLDKQELGEP